jgi:hypothetical protein
MRHPHPRNLAAVLLVLSVTTGTIYAQEALVAPQPTSSGTLEIRSVSAYFDYYSSTLPNGGALQASAKLLSDVAGGGSAQIGWTKTTERSNSSFSYTSSLTGRVRYSQLNAWNHALSFTTNHKIVPRWTLGFSARGDLSSVEQSLFAPTALGNVAAVPATFDDLATALLASKFTNPQLGSVLTGAPLLESPLRYLLYGQRMFTSGVQTSLSYSYSPRLTISFQGGASRSQHVSDDQANISQNLVVIPNTTTGSAGVTVSYSLSPRSQIGGTVTTTRVISAQQDAYTTISLANVGWTLARRWVLQLHGGVGFNNLVRPTSLQVSPHPLPAGGGSLTFKSFEHIFIGSFDHTVADAYGLGATSTSSAAFTWRWSRPGRPWWIESTFGWQQLVQPNGLGDISGWRTNAGFGRTIGAQLALLTQYGYLNYSGRQQNIPSAVDQSVVRVSLMWSPHPEYLRRN